jgi:hypothetical protein
MSAVVSQRGQAQRPQWHDVPTNPRVAAAQAAQQDATQRRGGVLVNVGEDQRRQPISREEAEHAVLQRMQQRGNQQFTESSPVRLNRALSYDAMLDAAIAAEQARSRPTAAQLANAHQPTLIYSFPLPEDHPAIAGPSDRARRALEARQREVTQQADETLRRRIAQQQAPRRNITPTSPAQIPPSQHTPPPARVAMDANNRAQNTPERAQLQQQATTPTMSTRASDAREAELAVEAALSRAVNLSLAEHNARQADAVLRNHTPPPHISGPLATASPALSSPASSTPVRRRGRVVNQPWPPSPANAIYVTHPAGVAAAQPAPSPPRRVDPTVNMADRATPQRAGPAAPVVTATPGGGATTAATGGGWEISDFSYETLMDLGSMAVSTGLSKDQLARYKSRPYPADVSPADCPVCLDDVVAGQPTLTLACKHSFHDACIRSWLARTNRCPTCRFEVPRR